MTVASIGSLTTNLRETTGARDEESIALRDSTWFARTAATRAWLRSLQEQIASAPDDREFAMAAD